VTAVRLSVRLSGGAANTALARARARVVRAIGSASDTRLTKADPSAVVASYTTPGWWGEEPPFHMPVFVLTHHGQERLTLSDTTFTFVTDGIEAALD
jgi:hypothetical protein